MTVPAGIPANASESDHRRRFLNTFILAIAIRLIIACVLVLWECASPTPPHPNAGHYVTIPPNLTLAGQLLVKWDGYWYLNIVRNGYETRAEGTGSSNAAFAPFYPACIYLLTQIGIAAWVGGALISLVCYCALLYYLHEFGITVHSARLGRALMLFVSVFPSAWVLNMVYSESMFCLWLAAFLVHYAKGNYRSAGLFALLLPLTRIVGIVIVPAIIVDILVRARRAGRIGSQWKTLIGAVAGVAILAVVYTCFTGSPVAFLGAGVDWPSRAEARGRWLPLVYSLAVHFRDRPEATLYSAFFLVYCIVCVQLIRVRRDVGGWFSAFYLVALLQMPYLCQMRFLLPCIPLHAVLVDRASRSKSVFIPVCVLLAILQILLARLSLTWHIVA